MDLIINRRMPDEQIFHDVSTVDDSDYQEFGEEYRYIVRFYSYKEQKHYRIKCFSFDEVEIPKEYTPLKLVK